MFQLQLFFGSAKYGIDIQIVRPEMTKFKMFRDKIFILWELHSEILVGDVNVMVGSSIMSITYTLKRL
jgi:hypothetical protein